MTYELFEPHSDWPPAHQPKSTSRRLFLLRLNVVDTITNKELSVHRANIPILRVQASDFNRENLRSSLWNAKDLGAAVTTEVMMVKLARVS
ncbi:hypothetical protein FOXYSP1_18744 [Fusarium oxysporum f. sp. phaseoli]